MEGYSVLRRLVWYSATIVSLRASYHTDYDDFLPSRRLGSCYSHSDLFLGAINHGVLTWVKYSRMILL
jgi:hypothetical protein